MGEGVPLNIGTIAMPKKKKYRALRHLKKSGPNTVTAIYSVSVMILADTRGINFKIILSYLKKISETNTSPGQNRDYSADAFGSFFCINFVNGRSMKVTANLPPKSLYCCFVVKECFREITYTQS